jgi:thiamine-monophosphate kinase
MESELIDWLRERTGGHDSLALGIGDDGAILRWGDDANLVVAADLLAEGTHFRLEPLGPRRVGRKALAVNLSDVAAMAARPVAATVSLLLPRQGAERLARELFEGLLPLAAEFDVAIAGGDTNTWDGPLAIDVVVLGRLTPAGPLLRSAAKTGDRILITGQLGGSILGRHADFQPRVNEAIRLRTEFDVRAGMDVSDGLALDLSRMLAASGVGGALDVDRVPIHADARQLAQQQPDGGDELTHALSDGEDFELLLTAPPDVAERLITEQPLDVPLTDIGEIVAAPGLFQREGGGALRPLESLGYVHRAEGGVHHAEGRVHHDEGDRR